MTRSLSTLEIAAKAKPHVIFEVANKAGLRAEEIEAYGHLRAKISLRVLERYANRPHGKLICVTSMTPTKEGEGKTCTSIGLAEALGVLKKKVILCLREPSLAPIFSYKGGATGAGYAQVLPMEDINLHFNGDVHAIETAHNLLAASIENHVHRGNTRGLDPQNIFWRRALDMSDRQLRSITEGHAKASALPNRRTGFDVTAASEVMSILSLSNSIPSMKSKLSKISVALSKDKGLVTAQDLKVSGAMALLLKSALLPNLVQTLEGQPVFMHLGPFANVSHGNSSLLSLVMALKLANYVVTECGLGADLGLEKFFNILSREGDLKPNVAVLVVTVRAIKSHAGDAAKAPKLIDAFRPGFTNIEKHIENIRKFGVDVVVAINRFPEDTDDEVRIIKDYLHTENIECAVSEAVKLGGKGAVELGEKVLKLISDKASRFKPLYETNALPEEKIEKVAAEVYGAAGVTYSESAKKDLELVHKLNLDALPVCISKTAYSLSDEPELKGAPSGWKLKIREVRPYTGAGFLVASTAEKPILMPGLPEQPIFEGMDLSDDGHAKGLF